MNLKKMTALLLALVISAAFCACASERASVGIIGGADGPTAILVTDSAKNGAVDPDAVAAQVGDRTITVGDLESYYNSMLSQYSAYGMPAPTADADIETFQDQVLTILIEQEMLAYQAEQLGHAELTAEQEDEIQAVMEEERAAFIEYYSQMVTEETADEKALEEAAIALINEELIAAGIDMDFDTYCSETEESYRVSYAIRNLETAVKAEATIEEAEAKTYYDTLLAEQQAAVSEDPLTYLDVQNAYEMSGGEPGLVVPEGFVRVKVLTVEPKEALSEDYDVLMNEMTALEAEYGKLALTGTDAARQNEIKKAYQENKTASEELWEAYVKDARTAANEAYAKLEDGEPFDTVFIAYGEDTSYIDYPVFASKGCLLTPGTDDGMWDDAIREAAKTLTVGAYSEIIEIDGSYHIVYLVSEEEAREVPYEEVQEAMHALALEQRAATLWEERQEEWSEDESLVTYYEANYRGVGKNA